jgi:hypothetical protein
MLEIRYTLAASPAVYLLIPMILGKGKLPWLLPALAACACVIGFPQTYGRTNSDFRGAANSWVKAASPNDPLVIACGGWDQFYGGLLYLAVDHYAPAPPRTVVFLDGPPPENLDASLRRSGRAWLLMGWGIGPDSVMPGWRSRKIEDEPGTAVLYEMRPADGAIN